MFLVVIIKTHAKYVNGCRFLMGAESQYFAIKWTATSALRKATPEITT